MVHRALLRRRNRCTKRPPGLASAAHGRALTTRDKPSQTRRVNARRLWRNNRLSVVLFVLFLCAWGGQGIARWKHENEDRRSHGRPQSTLVQYALSPGFLEATGENWESEFLQMAAYVWLTVFLF